jgi:hypothetical protein
LLVPKKKALAVRERPKKKPKKKVPKKKAIAVRERLARTGGIGRVV